LNCIESQCKVWEYKNGPYVADTSAEVFDLSVKFEGQTKAEFVMTTAWASSLINGSRSVLVFMKSHPAQYPHLPRQQQVILTYLLTYLLTPWSRVLLEKLTGSEASQEIPRIFGTRMFITVLTSARHLSLSGANSIQSPQPAPTS